MPAFAAACPLIPLGRIAAKSSGIIHRCRSVQAGAWCLTASGAGSDRRSVLLSAQARERSVFSRYSCRKARRPACASTSIPHREERYLSSMFVECSGSTRLRKTLAIRYRFFIATVPRRGSQAVIECGGQTTSSSDGPIGKLGSLPPANRCLQASRRSSRSQCRAARIWILKHDLREPIRFGIGITAAKM